MRRPCTFAATRPRLVQRLGHDPLHAGRRGRRRLGARRQGHGDQRVPRRAVVGETAFAERDLRAHALRDPAFELGPARRAGARPAAGARGAAARRRRSPRRPSPSRCSGTGGRRAPGRDRSAGAAPSPARAAARTTIPGVQKPHCDPPWSTNPATSASRRVASRPSTVVTARPATRATGVTQATRASPSTSTVQQPHCPCGAQPSFAETTPSRSRSTERSDSPGNASTTTDGAVARERDPIPSSGHGEAG